MSTESSKTNPWKSHLRTASSGAVVLLLIQLASAKDLFSEFSRPAITFALHLLGIQAVNQGNIISVGRLEVPWSRDCAGLNLLVVLLALTIWLNRSESVGWRYWLKIALTVPAALLANVMRVLCIIGYREFFYPMVESPQLHYFFGLIWLLPFVALVVPKGQRPLSHVLVEALQAAAIVALLAPLAGVPSGNAITIAVIIGLAHCKVQTDSRPLRSWLTVGWMFLALVIALLGMESFWMPWLLICPLMVTRSWIFSVSGIVLTAGSHPLFGIIPGGGIIIWLGIAWFCWQYLQKNQPDSEEANAPVRTGWRWQIHLQMAGVFFLLPFLASVFFVPDKRTYEPPATTEYTPLAADAYDVRVPTQADNIGLIWFNPSGNGRHHSMKVCMKYRGVDLEPTSEQASVYTDGQHWMREFYLVQEDQLVATYPAYILQTLRPGSSPGVHLIFVAKMEEMSPAVFDQSCQQIAARLHDLCVAADAGKNHPATKNVVAAVIR